MNRRLLALAFATLIGIGACCGSDSDEGNDVDDGTTIVPDPELPTLVETLFEGIAKFDVTSTYGQFWARGGFETNINLHEGIDFAAPAGTPVRAIERGKIRLIDGPSTGYEAQVLVVSEADPTRGWLYVHVDDTNRAVEAGIDVIQPGEQLGEICADPAGVVPPHLHLQRVQVHDVAVACPGATTAGTELHYTTLRNPLDELVVPDEVDPEILEFMTYPKDSTGNLVKSWVELHSPVLGGELDPVAPSAAHDKELVLVFQVRDHFLAGGQPVAPKSLALSILDKTTGAVEELPPLTFSGPLRTECGGGIQLGSGAYMFSAWRKSVGGYSSVEREFYVCVTTRLQDVGGSLVGYSEPWTPAAGEYELTLTVTDASGRSDEESVILVLGSS